VDSLFDSGETGTESPAAPAGAPLAARLRPAVLGDVVGQQHLLHEGAPLRTAIESGRPHSMVLYGPPGTGKTTLARLVADGASAAFEELSAVQVGKAEVTKVLERARHRREMSQQTVFFLDEIHRFNKAQQDALLPAVEEGLVVLIGATTENPYFEVNSALLSRMQVYELHALDAADVRAVVDRGLVELGGSADKEALDFLAGRAGGDARTALAALELAVRTTGHVTLEAAEEALQRRALRYDKKADQHYDTISAWIKATRGSDPDASLYYLAIMLEGGEDPRFIARRMVILASEDVGNADPQALVVAVAAANAVEHVGMPEAMHALSQCAIYLSLAPKSNAAYRAISAARDFIREHGAQLPPDTLRSGPGYPVGYDNPHNRPGGLSEQELLPPGVAGARFYEPGEQEPALRERLEAIRRARGRL